MSIQSDIRAIADAAFNPGERSKGLALSLGLSLAISSINKVTFPRQATLSRHELFLESFFQSTTETLSVLNETLLFDIRLAQRAVRGLFLALLEIKEEPFKISTSSQAKCLYSTLFPAVEEYLSEEEIDFLSNNINTVTSIHHLLSDEGKGEPIILD